MAMIHTLMDAAKKAEGLSESRRKQFRLELVTAGVRVVGLYSDLVSVTREYQLEVQWWMISDQPESLANTIDDIDRKITEEWRAAGR